MKAGAELSDLAPTDRLAEEVGEIFIITAGLTASASFRP